jgi:hypothetical protein
MQSDYGVALKLAERRVMRGVLVLALQRKRVADLERSGQDATEAKRLLAQYETLQTEEISVRDRLRKEGEAALANSAYQIDKAEGREGE